LAEKLKKQSRQERKENEKERGPTAPFFIANY
jgi:hypothetical protein